MKKGLQKAVWPIVISCVMVVAALVVVNLIKYSGGETVKEEKMLPGGILVQTISENLSNDGVQISLTDQACPEGQRFMYELWFSSDPTEYLHCDGKRSFRGEESLYGNDDLGIKRYLEESEEIYKHHEVGWRENT